MKNLIKQLLRENLLSEKYDFHTELDSLASDIFKLAISHYAQKSYLNKNTFSVLDEIRFVFSKIPHKYPNLKEFMKEYNLSFKLIGNLKALADFMEETEDSGLIRIRYDLNRLRNVLQEKVIDDFKENGLPQSSVQELLKDLYFELYTNQIHSSIVHELQHAFDAWRSNGNFATDKRTKKYHKKYADAPMTDEMHDEYLKLQHEINARFSQAISDIKFYVNNNNLDNTKPSEYKFMYDFPKIKIAFEGMFKGYSIMNPRVKKRLINRLINVYNNAKASVDKFNSELLSNGKAVMNENLLAEIASGKQLVVVDVQPEYYKDAGNIVNELLKYISKNYDNLYNLTFLYNGESMGMISESSYKFWLYEMGISEDIIDGAYFYDKGYAFFRSCMDKGGDEEELVNLIRFMMANDINDSRDLTNEFWDAYVKEFGGEDIREMLEKSQDCINIPELMEYLSDMNNIVLVGGFRDQCLKEVELALDALGKNYETWQKFVY